jgi:UDP-N-acetylmuramoyl-tripeptide--D-alanyl-D-alanine ligase
MDIQKLYSLYLENRLVSIDSRNISPGSLFFALKGENFNGNLFALQAIEKGASAAIVDEDPENSHPRIFKVKQVLTALQKLASYHRQQSRITILAITGSNGKTTTKELCRAVLSVKFRVYATAGNLNNHIGVPLTLLAMDHTIQLGIVEMGANHPGEIRDLCAIARPDFGIVTNVGKAHLEGFGNLEGVARAKGELFEFLMQNNKTIFLNEGDEYIRNLVPADYPDVVRYNGISGLRTISRSNHPFLNLTLTDGHMSGDLETRLVGGYNAENVLAAFCAGLYFNVPFTGIRDAIQAYNPTNNRSQLIENGKNKIFMDAYNANPSSMRAAVDEFLSLQEGNKLLILGEMRELGDSGGQEHASLIGYLNNAHVQKVICIGKSFESAVAGTEYLYFESVEQLITYLSAHPVTGCNILIKGSRANRLENILAVL